MHEIQADSRIDILICCKSETDREENLHTYKRELNSPPPPHGTLTIRRADKRGKVFKNRTDERTHTHARTPAVKSRARGRRVKARSRGEGQCTRRSAMCASLTPPQGPDTNFRDL